MGMTPVSSNVDSRSCDNPLSSNCVTSQVPAAPCLNICKNPSQTQVDYAQNNAICSLLNLTDLTGIDLGCLYETNFITWTCPVGQEFRADSSAFPINGTPGFCQSVSLPHVLTTNVPVQTSTPNPLPPPTTLKGILELMISKIPCCDPCSLNASGGVNPGS